MYITSRSVINCALLSNAHENSMMARLSIKMKAIYSRVRLSNLALS